MADDGCQAADAFPCHLYLLTPPVIDLPSFPDQLRAAIDAGEGVVQSLQLRLKDSDADSIRRAADALLPLCRERDIAFILNDDPALAVEIDADGVHLGREDMPVAEARALVGEERVVGASCYDSSHRAMQAGEDGADYIAFGAFFPSQTKAPPTQADIALLRDWAAVSTLPIVAIGGITPENCRPLVEAGADFLAVCGGVWHHPAGPAEAVKAFRKQLA